MSEPKVLIICSSPRKFSPYIEFYVEECKKNGVNYILITKEEDGYEIKSEYHMPHILTKQLLATSAINRTISWYKHINQIIKSEGCNKLIVMPTRTAIILFPLLLFTRKPYIFDIRDYTNENKRWYLFLEKILMKKAHMTVISSRGFLKWLPYTKNHNIIHNMPVNYEIKTNQRLQSSTYSKINIAYVGMIDYFEQNASIADKLCNSQRYSLKYSGVIAKRCKIKEYIDEKFYANIQFTGPFNNDEKYKLYMDADMINAVYGNDSLIVTTAIPNKLYDALIYKIPIIASEGTFLGEIVSERKIGIAVDAANDNLEDKLDEFWNDFKYDSFEEECERFLKEIINEQNETCKKIKAFMLGGSSF